MVIADFWNHRVVQWKMGDTDGQVVAGGRGKENELDQLNHPIDVSVDKETDSFIISDHINRRILRWSRRSRTTPGEILLDHISCYALAIDDQKYLYISDPQKHGVRRYKMGDKNGIVVASGNGQGASLNQVSVPTYIFVDREQSVCVCQQQSSCDEME
ncbi:unnamed protein product [Rotaria sp. Silwood2]|nr:unnamed protein product [Rotaria sp. Silwood2]